MSALRTSPAGNGLPPAGYTPCHQEPTRLTMEASTTLSHLGLLTTYGPRGEVRGFARTLEPRL
jgi:hypothetical protein